MKQKIYWIAALTLGWALLCFAPELLGWELMSGFTGLVVKFFLGYCAIILVAQVIAALAAIRSALEDLTRAERVPRRMNFR